MFLIILMPLLERIGHRLNKIYLNKMLCLKIYVAIANANFGKLINEISICRNSKLKQDLYRIKIQINAVCGPRVTLSASLYFLSTLSLKLQIGITSCA